MRAADETDSPYGAVACLDKTARSAWFQSNRLVVQAENTYYKPDTYDEVGADYVSSVWEDVLDEFPTSLESSQIHSVRYQQNYIYWSSFWTKLFGINDMELLGFQKPAVPVAMRDADLTRGYLVTLLYVKSSFYTVTNVSKYVFIDFLAHLAAVAYGLWWLYRFLHWLFPMRLN